MLTLNEFVDWVLGSEQLCLVIFFFVFFGINRIQGKYMLENKRLSDREIMYQFLRRIPIRNRTIAYDIVNCDSNEKRVLKVPDNIVIDVTTPH